MNLASGHISKKQDSEVTGTVKNRLFPSDLGITVSDFLDEHFDKIMDYNFTAGIEKKFDRIATGGQEWTKMLNEFYGHFHATVEDTLENAERATGERILGKDPETGRTLLTRITRNGPVAQIGTQEELEEGEKPKYANLRPGQSIETITAEEALKLFELPRVLGNYMNEEISVGAGRYGPYIKYGEKKFVSIPRTEDPLKISMERAKELINEKEKAEAPVGTYKGLPIQKGKGRFGPFLKWNNLFVNIPRRFDPETIELEQMHELIEAKVQKEANRYIHQWPDESWH